MSTQFRKRLANLKWGELVGMPLRAFFISSFRYVMYYLGFSGQTQFCWVSSFKECIRVVLVQILYSTSLHCVFPVLLFYPHTHTWVWAKHDCSVHITVFRLKLLPSLLQLGWVVVLGHLLHRSRGGEGPRLPPGSGWWCRGRQLLDGARAPCVLLVIFSPEFESIAITFSANAEAIPEENKQVYSVIEHLVQYRLNQKSVSIDLRGGWVGGGGVPGRLTQRKLCQAAALPLAVWPARPASGWQLLPSQQPAQGVSSAFWRKERWKYMIYMYEYIQYIMNIYDYMLYCYLPRKLLSKTWHLFHCEIFQNQRIIVVGRDV